MGRNIDNRKIVDLADAVQQAEAETKGEGLHRPIFGEGVDILNDDAAQCVDTRGDQLRQRVFCNARSVDRADLLCCGWHTEHLDARGASHEFDKRQGAMESGVDAENDRFHYLATPVLKRVFTFVAQDSQISNTAVPSSPYNTATLVTGFRHSSQTSRVHESLPMILLTVFADTLERFNACNFSEIVFELPPAIGQNSGPYWASHASATPLIRDRSVISSICVASVSIKGWGPPGHLWGRSHPAPDPALDRAGISPVAPNGGVNRNGLGAFAPTDITGMVGVSRTAY